jgi:hypothetical protein
MTEQTSVTEVPLTEALSAACAALRINTKYVRREEATEEVKANSWLMTDILNGKIEITDADREEGANLLSFLQGKLPDLIAETLESYWQKCVLMTELKMIRVDDYKNIAFIASMPSSYFNAQQREEMITQMNILADNSSHFGNKGDVFPAQRVEIVGAVYSRNYFKWYHTALTEQKNMIRFPMTDKIEPGTSAVISGKIHKHGDSNTTILHYVRKK